MSDAPVLVIVGHMRSGTTVLHDLLLKSCGEAVDLADDTDFECRPFWQALGLKIGSRKTGTYCHCATPEAITPALRDTVQDYLEQRSAGDRRIITKNPHLCNKIAFVAELMPQVRFVHIVREVMSVVSSTKLGFERANVSNESYPAFVHYWPDVSLPCWWTVRNDMTPWRFSAEVLRRQARESFVRLGLKHVQRPSGPFRLYRHECLSRFLQNHPDSSRYYPGDGFARLPEAWMVLNANARSQLASVGPARALTVNYAELVRDTRNVLKRILRFADMPARHVEDIPPQLDVSRGEQWKKYLTDEQQELCRDALVRHQAEFDSVCSAAGDSLCAG